MGLQKSKDLEPQHSNVNKIIDRACCSQDKADVQTKAHETVLKSVANNKPILNKQSPEMVKSRSVSDGNGACSADEKFQNEKGEESIHIRQVKAGSSFVQMKVGSMDINAKIDSGAEIIILSSKIFEQLKKAPAKNQRCRLTNGR